MRIKCCGITRPEDARCAEIFGAHAIGVVVFSGGVSRRIVTPERAREIFDAVGPFTATVAVSHTKSEEDLQEMLALKPSAIQISHPFVFEEDPGVAVIRVIGRGDPLPEDCDAVIVDDSHGQGKTFDLSYTRGWTHAGKCSGCDRAGAPVCRRCCKRHRDSAGYQRP
jgi:phosphoribosylanthranilate isomerase